LNNQPIRILLIGPYGSLHREVAISRGFQENGAVVMDCSYGDLLFRKNIFSRIQFRLGFGPVFNHLTNRVCDNIEAFNPDIIFFRRPLEFAPWMLIKIKKKSSALMVSFNNDDPFSSVYKDFRWRKLRKGIPVFDLHFAFRRKNIDELYSYGAKRVSLFEPYFSPWLHKPITPDISPNNEVLFAMHAEFDNRMPAVLALIEAGIKVRIHSWNWKHLFGKTTLSIMPPIWGEDYVSAVNQSMATLCFFSKQNNDELTSRVFEIPACGGILVAERNERITELFKDGEEAVFFSSIDELVERIKLLCSNSEMALRIRQNGRNRVILSKHSIVDRCAKALEVMHSLL